MQLRYLIFIAIGLLLLFVSVNGQSPAFSDEDCLSCHGKPEISQIMHDGSLRSLYVDPEEWSRDIHHRGQISCIDCHTNAHPFLHFREGFIDVDCARCHPIEAEEYQKNIHQTFRTATPGKELPLCYHCHTKHHILRHDDPQSSVHESQIGRTCGTCHPEIMVKGILEGTSLGKISGHRKGDLAEKFDMHVCLNCHYQDSAHGAKRVYKDFCSRCHDVRSKGELIIGPTHLDDARWSSLNIIGNALFFLLLAASGTVMLYKSRKRISSRIAVWWENMKIPVAPEETTPEPKPSEIADKQENHENE